MAAAVAVRVLLELLVQELLVLLLLSIEVIA
jgi:hypothetical protein